MIDFSKILVRASAMGDIMANGDEITEKQLETLDELLAKAKTKGLTEIQKTTFNKLIDKRDNPELGEVTKTRLTIMYAFERYGRVEEVNSKYMEKGTICEPDAITLYSRVKGKFFKKNDVRITNRYLSGEPDMSDTETGNIQDAEEIIDMKSSWSLITFLLTQQKDKANPKYRWQGHTYLALVPKAQRFRLAHALVNSPSFILDDEKRKLSWQMRVTSTDSADPDFVKACRQLEKNHIFDMPLFVQQNPGYSFHNDEWEDEWNIPMEKRIHEIVIERDQAAIDKMYAKIPRCRKYLEETFGQ